MAPTTFSSKRLAKNLKKLRFVRVRVAIDLPGMETVLESGAEQNVLLAAADILHKNGIRNRNQSGVPQLEIEIVVRPLLEPTTRKYVIVYRVETALREKVRIDRSGADSSADTWRHRAEVKYADAATAVYSAPAILNEVRVQIEAFVSDWRSANGFGDAEEARGDARDDLKALIPDIGPIYERILQGAGVLTIRDLAGLVATDARDIVLADLTAKNPSFTPARLDTWVTKAEELLKLD